MKARKPNDKKGPRMKKAQFSKSVITKDLWKDFREKFPEYSHLTDRELNDYWKDIAQIIREEAITNPLGVKLGSYTGEIKLQYLPHKFKAEDLKTSSEIGEPVNHVNLVTRGKVAKIKWERRWAVKFNKMLAFWQFTATREMNHMAKNHIENNPDSVRTARNTLGGHSVWRQL